MQPFTKPKKACEGSFLLRWWSATGAGALLRAAAEKLDHRKPVAETSLVEGFLLKSCEIQDAYIISGGAF